MADNQFIVIHDTGLHIYVTMQLESNSYAIKPADGSTEVFAGANIANYAVVLTEGSGDGRYAGSVPSTTPQNVLIDVVVRLRAGGSPSSSDTVLGGTNGIWDGTNFTANYGTFGSVNVVSNSSDLSIFWGMDYLAADSRQLEFVNNDWQSIIGATVSFVAKDFADTTILTKTATIVTSTNCYVELTKTDTALFSTDTENYKYSLVAVLSNTDTVELAYGNLLVNNIYSPTD